MPVNSCVYGGILQLSTSLPSFWKGPVQKLKKRRRKTIFIHSCLDFSDKWRFKRSLHVWKRVWGVCSIFHQQSKTPKLFCMFILIFGHFPQKCSVHCTGPEWETIETQSDLQRSYGRFVMHVWRGSVSTFPVAEMDMCAWCSLHTRTYSKKTTVLLSNGVAWAFSLHSTLSPLLVSLDHSTISFVAFIDIL